MKRTYFAVVFALLLGACGVNNNQATLLVYIEQEKGIDPYAIRIIGNQRYLRMDDGENSETYVIFDRQSRTIFNVNQQHQTVMSINPVPSEAQPPFVLKHTVKQLETMRDAPKIHGQVPMHWQYSTNDTVCLDVVSVDGVFTGITALLKEFHQVLADDSAAMFYQVPADLHDPCDISKNIFNPGRQYQNGFPIREWRPNGYQRILQDYQEEFATPPGFFDIPSNYFTYTVQQLRDGMVDLERRAIIDPASEKTKSLRQEIP